MTAFDQLPWPSIWLDHIKNNTTTKTVTDNVHVRIDTISPALFNFYRLFYIRQHSAHYILKLATKAISTRVTNMIGNGIAKSMYHQIVLHPSIEKGR